MRVLILAPYLCNSFGGVAPVVWAHAEHLGRAGIAIDVISTTASMDKEVPPDSDWQLHPHFRFRQFSCWQRQDLVWSFSCLAWLWQNAPDYDLVHTHTLFSPFISAAHFLLTLHQKPWVNTPHGMLETWALANRAGKKKLYFNFLEKPLLQLSTIQALSTSESTTISSLGFSQIFPIPNGISLSEFNSLPNPETFYNYFPHTRNKNLILFLGRLDPKKGLDLLASAFAHITELFPETHLVIAGPDHINFLTQAKAYFENAKCLQAVTFTGMLRGEIKLSALAAASLYVAPSYSEGFSMSVLEAMASGLPCVITTGCNFPESDEAGVAKVVPIGANSIAQALQECLADMDKARDMGSRARQFIFENYTWDRVATKLIEVYQQILDKSRSGLS